MGPEVEERYDSSDDTKKHIAMVQFLLAGICESLRSRSSAHDKSKLASPEKQVFDEFTPKLRGSTYGSAEYDEFLGGMKVALDHHYSENRHHPEHFQNGVAGMDLVDVVEMFCDWLAATKRHANGDIYKSISINQKRFEFSDDLASIFRNTADKLK